MFAVTTLTSQNGYDKVEQFDGGALRVLTIRWTFVNLANGFCVETRPAAVRKPTVRGIIEA